MRPSRGSSFGPASAAVLSRDIRRIYAGDAIRKARRCHSISCSLAAATVQGHRMPRCPWATIEPAIAYHDEEWGVPIHDDRRLFEFLILEGAQAGLSWITILRKRAAYRAAFAGFDPEAVARFDEAKGAELLANPGIVRNRLKVASTITNARAFLAVQEEFGSFDAYQWRFVDGRSIRNAWQSLQEIPAGTPVSDAMSRDLK